MKRQQNIIDMASTKTYIIATLFLALCSCLILSSCKNEDDSFPITDDLRVLQVNQDGKSVQTGVNGIPLLPSFELVFSHALNTTTFESALDISPETNYSVQYDDTKSLATITFSDPLDYATEYLISLPSGAYGADGEALVDALIFNFETESFVEPGIQLSTTANSLFEGESAEVTATIENPILLDVSVDLVYGGTADGPGNDFTTTANSLIIPAGSTSASMTLQAINDGTLEGEEIITITLSNLINAVEKSKQEVVLAVGDTPPSIEIKGVMSLKIGGTSTNGRAIHFRVLEDISDLSQYGIGIANNGGGSDGREIDFPSMSATAGQDLLLVRDDDLDVLSAYFEECTSAFDQIFTSPDINFNGDDPFELYQDNIVIETYGDVEFSGAGLEWEWTGSWAYKFKGDWVYASVDCSENSTTTLSSDCTYPICTPIQLTGVAALLWDGSGTNGGKAVQLRANVDIPDLSVFGLGVANNGGGTDGVEFNFEAISANEGDQILVAREPATFASYIGSCFDGYDIIVTTDAMSQNGDDAIELFDGGNIIETFGDANVDGTGQPWEYTGSWAYKSGSVWTYGGIDCAATSTTTQSSACPYGFCN